MTEAGIPGELFEYVQQSPGLLERLEDANGIDDWIEAIKAAVGAGELHPLVGGHIVAWNEAKRDHPETYILAYADYCEEHDDEWLQYGLEHPRLLDFGGDFDDLGNIPFVRDPKVGRNAPCPCGSGRKHKHCCLA